MFEFRKAIDNFHIQIGMWPGLVMHIVREEFEKFNPYFINIEPSEVKMDVKEIFESPEYIFPVKEEYSGKMEEL